jgi:glycosidase
LTGHEAYFEGVYDRLTILDNHDMNRFYFLSGNDPGKLRLATLVLYTLAGTPINYYGTEVGVTQAMPTHYGGHGYFEEARQPMLWGDGQDKALLDYFGRLTAIRKKFPWLRGGERETIHLDAAAGTYVYLRIANGGRLLVAINTSADHRTAEVTLDGFEGADNLLNANPVMTEGNQIKIQLAPRSGAVLN